MKILIDTREQCPLIFGADEIVSEIVKVKLDVGDYAAEYSDGSRCPIIFERKSLNDLWGTMTTGYARFKKEMDRAKAQKVSLILAIEGSYTDVYQGIKYSRYGGDTMIKKLMTLWQKYELTPMFFRNRGEMQHAIRQFFEAFGRNFKLKKEE